MQEYKFQDATLMIHGQNYLEAAVLLHEKREIDYFPYPILTLSAFSIEMFFKGFFSEPCDRSESISVSTGLKVSARHKMKVGIKGHSFSQLFEKFEEDHEALANYLKTEYFKIYNTGIAEDLDLYSDIFIESRYAYEYPHFTNTRETKYAAQVANLEKENAEKEAEQAQIKAEVEDRKELEKQARQAKNISEKAKEKAEKSSKKQFESLEAMMGNLLKISQFLYDTFYEFVQKQPITPEQQVWDSYIEQRRKNR